MDLTDEDILCTRVADMFNPEEIIDILGLNSEELVEELRNYIIDYSDRFTSYMEAVDDGQEGA